MNNPLYFKTREAFRTWLTMNCESSGGVWLCFGKTKEVVTLTANEALEEALCFGWIDGVMKRIDDKSYIKYFSTRARGSKWSEKNKTIVERLERQALMTDFGRVKIEEAKKNGQWDHANKAPEITNEQMVILSDLLKQSEEAYIHFQGMPPSVKKTYARAYFDAKTDAGRIKRLQWMVARLEKNLKPM